LLLFLFEDFFNDPGIQHSADRLSGRCAGARLSSSADLRVVQPAGLGVLPSHKYSNASKFEGPTSWHEFHMRQIDERSVSHRVLRTPSRLRTSQFLERTRGLEVFTQLLPFCGPVRKLSPHLSAGAGSWNSLHTADWFAPDGEGAPSAAGFSRGL
jgi:hypothetical protein